MPCPNYAISIQPQCDSEGICQLSVSVTLDSPAQHAQDVLCEFDADTQGLSTQTYTTENFRAKDEAGSLPLALAPPSASSPGRVWKVQRDTVGAVTLHLEVRPEAVDAEAPAADPLSDLRRDQGGVLGPGGWFLPRVPSHERFLFSVEWDLSRAPAGTRACWSYGEGSARTEREGPLPLLEGSLFMVGPMQSAREEQGAGAAISTVYWFGELPEFLLEPAKQFSKHMIPYAYDAFEDEMETHGVFVRKGHKGFSGHNFTSSLLLQYSDERGKCSDADVISILTHELVHNWLYLGNEPGEPPNMWYIEGIAQFYSLFLPVRAGFRGADYFCEVLDKFLCSYYTNDLINVPLHETETQFDDDPRAVWTPYMRGAVYLLLVDASLRQACSATDKQNPIDDVVMSLTKDYREGKQITSSTWLEALYPLLGKDVVDAPYRMLVEGGTLPLDGEFTFPVGEHVFALKPVKHEVYELGFSAKSLRSGVVEGLLPSSRAALAGLQNGDQIQHLSRPSLALSNFELKVSFSVKRPGNTEIITGEFWPRSFDKVGSFKTVIVDQSAPKQ